MFKKYFLLNFLSIQNFFLFLLFPFKIFFYFLYLIHKRPFSYGYNFHKWRIIKKNLLSKKIFNTEYIDERVVEYNWIIQNLKKETKYKKKRLLDAGSTINFNIILKYLNKDFKIFIQTLFPEPYSKYYDGISYIYSDLREKIFEKNYFDVITCISTLEHIGLENSEYNFFNINEIKKTKFNINNVKKRDDIIVIKEFNRILKKGGSLLLTVPYGKKNIYKSLRQYDDQMINQIINTFNGKVKNISYATYKNNKWKYCDKKDCIITNFGERISKNEIVASARSVVMLHMTKK